MRVRFPNQPCSNDFRTWQVNSMELSAVSMRRKTKATEASPGNGDPTSGAQTSSTRGHLTTNDDVKGTTTSNAGTTLGAAFTAMNEDGAAGTCRCIDAECIVADVPLHQDNLGSSDLICQELGVTSSARLCATSLGGDADGAAGTSHYNNVGRVIEDTLLHCDVSISTDSIRLEHGATSSPSYGATILDGVVDSAASNPYTGVEQRLEEHVLHHDVAQSTDVTRLELGATSSRMHGLTVSAAPVNPDNSVSGRGGAAFVGVDSREFKHVIGSRMSQGGPASAGGIPALEVGHEAKISNDCETRASESTQIFVTILSAAQMAMDVCTSWSIDVFITRLLDSVTCEVLRSTLQRYVLSAGGFALYRAWSGKLFQPSDKIESLLSIVNEDHICVRATTQIYPLVGGGRSKKKKSTKMVTPSPPGRASSSPAKDEEKLETAGIADAGLSQDDPRDVVELESAEEPAELKAVSSMEDESGQADAALEEAGLSSANSQRSEDPSGDADVVDDAAGHHTSENEESVSVTVSQGRQQPRRVSLEASALFLYVIKSEYFDYSRNHLFLAFERILNRVGSSLWSE